MSASATQGGHNHPMVHLVNEHQQQPQVSSGRPKIAHMLQHSNSLQTSSTPIVNCISITVCLKCYFEHSDGVQLALVCTCLTKYFHVNYNC